MIRGTVPLDAVTPFSQAGRTKDDSYPHGDRFVMNPVLAISPEKLERLV